MIVDGRAVRNVHSFWNIVISALIIRFVRHVLVGIFWKEVSAFLSVGSLGICRKMKRYAISA